MLDPGRFRHFKKTRKVRGHRAMYDKRDHFHHPLHVYHSFDPSNPHLGLVHKLGVQQTLSNGEIIIIHFSNATQGDTNGCSSSRSRTKHSNASIRALLAHVSQPQPPDVKLNLIQMLRHPFRNPCLEEVEELHRVRVKVHQGIDWDARQLGLEHPEEVASGHISSGLHQQEVVLDMAPMLVKVRECLIRFGQQNEVYSRFHDGVSGQ